MTALPALGMCQPCTGEQDHSKNPWVGEHNPYEIHTHLTVNPNAEKPTIAAFGLASPHPAYVLLDQ